MKKILQASLSAVLVLSLVGCGSTKEEAVYQDSIDAYVNEIDMDYAYDFTKKDRRTIYTYLRPSSICILFVTEIPAY